MYSHAHATTRLVKLVLVPILILTSLVMALPTPVSADIPVDPEDPGGGGGGGGSGGSGSGGSSAYSDISCSSIYIDYYQDVGSDAKGMWNSASGWNGCIAVTANGIEESGTYTVKVPYMTTSYNSSSRSGRKDVVAVHGATFDGDGWQPMCKYLLKKYSTKLYRCYAPSLTGMGGSGYPGANGDTWWTNGVELGNMREIEFAGALEAALAGIKAKDGLAMGEWILTGYSNGGMAIQMLQDRLRSQGTHLRAKYGIDKVVMMSSVLPHEVCWQYADDQEYYTSEPGYPFTTKCDDDLDETLLGTLIDTIWSQYEYDWDAGAFADPEPSYDDDEWVETWWSEDGEDDAITSNYDATIYGRLPTTNEAYYAANWMGWDSFNEMIGNDWLGWSRPSIDPDIWAGTNSLCYDRTSSGTPCTRFASVVFSHDKYFDAVDIQNLHKYLTTSSPTCVGADGAYHDCTIATGTHGGAFSIYATAWDNYVNSGYNTSKLKTSLDPIFDTMVNG